MAAHTLLTTRLHYVVHRSKYITRQQAIVRTHNKITKKTKAHIDIDNRKKSRKDSTVREVSPSQIQVAIEHLYAFYLSKTATIKQRSK